jgi:hypothetical protein
MVAVFVYVITALVFNQQSFYPNFTPRGPDWLVDPKWLQDLFFEF